MSENIKVLDAEGFEGFIGEGNSIVDFYADWCGPCKIMAPEFEKASGEDKDVHFGKINVENNQDAAVKFGVMSIPTIIWFKNGEQVDRHTGPLKSEEIIERNKKNFS